MAGLGSLAGWRHGVVAVTVLGGSALALTGLIGSDRQEHIENKQIVITPAGDDGVRIREVVDEDFGRNDRHGYQRLIPNDFGVPTGVEASSPGAPADVDVAPDPDDGRYTRIRVGDPAYDRHRAAPLRAHLHAPRRPALDRPAGARPDRQRRGRSTPTTSRSSSPASTSTTRCATSVPGGASRRVHPRPATGRPTGPRSSRSHAHDGVTIGGTIAGRIDAVEVDEPPLPDRQTDRSLALAGAMVPHRGAQRRRRVPRGPAGVAATRCSPVAPPTPRSARRPHLPPPGVAAPGHPARRRPGDGRSGDDRVRPPEGHRARGRGPCCVNERIDEDTVGAWFSGHAATRRAVDPEGRRATSSSPRARSSAPRHRRTRRSSDRCSTAPRPSRWTATTRRSPRRGARSAREEQRSIVASRFWKRLPPIGGGFSAAMSLPFLIVVVVVARHRRRLRRQSRALGVFSGPVGAVVFGLVVPGLVALAAYWTLLPVRSAYWLGTRSAHRVVPPLPRGQRGPPRRVGVVAGTAARVLGVGRRPRRGDGRGSGRWPHPASRPWSTRPGRSLVYSMGPAFHSARTAPSSSGSGGGGVYRWLGFSGGSVRGGGGGGSSGSW